MSLPRPAQFPPGYAEEDNSQPLLGTCIAFLIIETISMVLLYTSRFLSNDGKQQGENKANWSMISLMTCTYLVCLCKITLGFLAIQIGGAGRHTFTLSPETITTALQINTALQLVCPLTTSLSKLSILCLFHSIFGRTSARYRLVIRITFILCLAILFVQVIIPFVNCRPFRATWSLTEQDTACTFSGLSLWKYLSIPNVLATLVVVSIPIPALYKLRVSTATKIGLAVVLGVCVCGVVAAIMRFASFLAVRNFNDFTYDQIGPMVWTVSESGIYMVAGVLPTLRPLMRTVLGDTALGRMLTGSSRSTESGKRKSDVSGKSWGATGKEKQGSVSSNDETVVEVDDEEKGT